MNAPSLSSFTKSLTHLVRSALALATLLLLTILATPAADAQTYAVIHSFTGGGDGSSPQTGLTIDAQGNLYGTCAQGGLDNSGTVFRLKRSGSGWLVDTLYSFQGDNQHDGAGPDGRVALALDGTLYGTTIDGGSGCAEGGCGTVFHLAPPPTPPVLSPWNETILYYFAGQGDGVAPIGDLAFDQSGNIYGTVLYDGYHDRGLIYELMPSGTGWTETVLYAPQSDREGHSPYSGVVVVGSNTLYGVFAGGGVGNQGAIFQLSLSGSVWTPQLLHSFFGNDGANPYGGLIVDASGNLYGTTRNRGPGGAGTVFAYMPAQKSFRILYAFSGTGGGSVDKLVMDAAGNLYGTTYGAGAYGMGSVFKLAPSSGFWTYTSLHDFTGGVDGANPVSALVFDANGNLYGTASRGGTANNGVVFEITP